MCACICQHISLIVYILYIFPKDINECATNNGGCSQVCTDNEGSFVCSCNTGYELDADGTTCNGKPKKQFSKYYWILIYIHLLL